MGWDEARFYEINGRTYPSVTTILSVINKPALGPWYAKMERERFTDAVFKAALDLEERGARLSPEGLVKMVLKMVEGAKAGDVEKNRAADIGTAAHALIEWHTRTMLGEDPGPEPRVPDAAMLAVESWKDWAKQVDFEPIWVERVVYHSQWGYAGTGDWLARVRGVVTLGDVKTGKAIYPEAWLQNRAYRSAAESMYHVGDENEWGTAGHVIEQGMILRLPKSLADPTFEAQIVPETSLEDFLACKRLWEWTRRSSGKPTDRKS